MKGPKFANSKAIDPHANRADTSWLSSVGSRSPQLPLRVSLEQLRDPASKQSLRQHFTGAFPETHRVVSFDLSEGLEMGGKDRLTRTPSNLTVGRNETEDSSTSSVNSAGGHPKKLSAVPERSSTIDIEQAIHLLQELRKTASPQDLVALHKALLPTRDSFAPSPSVPIREEEDPNSSSVSLIRHRSLLPPGLATRASPDEDLLRRQEDVPVVKKLKKKSKRDLLSALKGATSHSDLAALDLANETVNPRAPTPSEDGKTPLGVYRYGTLRVTNGAASPVPSLATSIGKSLDLAIPRLPDLSETKQGSSIGHTPQSDHRASQDYYTDYYTDYDTAPDTPLDRQSMEFRMARSSFRDSASIYDNARSRQTSIGRQSDGDRRSRERSRPSNSESRSRERTRPRISTSRSRDALISGIPIPRDVDESSPRIYRPSRPHRSRTNSQSGVAQPQESSPSSRSQDSSLSRIPLRLETSKQSLRGRLETQVSALSLTPVKPDIDDGRVSPMPNDLPRFAQRWNHRASKVGEDRNSVPDASAYGDFSTLRHYEDRSALYKRLSTVYDGEGDDEDTTPEAALSKLSGGDRNPELTIETQLTRLNMRPNLSSPRSGNSNSLDRPTAFDKNDSGYGTDSSSRATHTKKSVDAKKAFVTPDEGVSLEEEGMSLYSFNQILKSPSLLQGFGMTSPPVESNTKKRPSLFRLPSSKKSSQNVVPTVSSDEVVAPSPMETKGAKQKKLQKPMPESLRQERKPQLKKQKQQQQQQDRQDSDVPKATLSEPYQISLPVEPTSPEHGRFSFEPIPPPTATAGATPVVVSPSQPNRQVHPTASQLNGDDGSASGDEAPTPRISLFRRRSKYRSTGEPSCISLNMLSDESSVASRTSTTISRGRKSGPASPKQTGFRGGSISCISGSDQSSDMVPLWRDHASVSRSAGCGPYDVSSGLIRRSVPVPSTAMHQSQAPHEVTTSLSRSKTGGLRGMDSDMASEFARMKSRDVAINKNEEVYDRPRTAKPKTRKDKSKNRSSASVPPLIEDRFPGREENVEGSVIPGFAELPARTASMYSESIPPMPDLPDNVETKVTRIDQMAARRKKEIVPLMPVVAAKVNGERPGDSTLSVAEAIRRAQLTRSSSESIKGNDGTKGAPRTKPAGPRKKKSQRIEPPEISSSDSDGTIIDQQRPSKKQEDSFAPVTDSKPQDKSTLERQAKHWRQHRKSAEESLSKSKPEYSVVLHASTTPTSPTILVSRHISSQFAETRTEPKTQTQTQVQTETTVRPRKDSAEIQADEYRVLIGNRSPTPSSDNRNEQFSYSAAKTVTVQRLTEQRPAKVTVPAHSPPSSKSALTPPEEPIERARSPGGRVITPSGNYHPYTPADAAQAQRSRAESLAKLTGTPISPVTVHRRAKQSQQTRTPVSPVTALPPVNHVSPAAALPSINHVASRQSTGRPAYPYQRAHKNAIEALFDRYSGGLEYNFERGVGVGGSAGTRSSKDRSNRKGKVLSEDYGVDLSDVPMFLQKIAQQS